MRGRNPSSTPVIGEEQFERALQDARQAPSRAEVFRYGDFAAVLRQISKAGEGLNTALRLVQEMVDEHAPEDSESDYDAADGTARKWLVEWRDRLSDLQDQVLNADEELAQAAIAANRQRRHDLAEEARRAEAREKQAHGVST